MKVWNLIYTQVDLDCYDAIVAVKTFSSEKNAMDALEHEYNDMVSDIEAGEIALDCIDREYNGVNAKIELGFAPRFDWDTEPEIELRHSWRIAMQTVDRA